MLAKNTAGENYLVKDANVKKLHPLTKLLTFAPSVSDRAAEAAHGTPFQIGLRLSLALADLTWATRLPVRWE